MVNQFGRAHNQMGTRILKCLNISEYWHRNTLNFRNRNNLAIYYCTLCPRNTSELIFPNSITRDSLCSEYLFQHSIILGKIILILGEIMKEFEKLKP